MAAFGSGPEQLACPSLADTVGVFVYGGGGGQEMCNPAAGASRLSRDSKLGAEAAPTRLSVTKKKRRWSSQLPHQSQ